MLLTNPKPPLLREGSCFLLALMLSCCKNEMKKLFWLRCMHCTEVERDYTLYIKYTMSIFWGQLWAMIGRFLERGGSKVLVQVWRKSEDRDLQGGKTMTKIRQRKYLKVFLDCTSRHGICQIYSGNGPLLGPFEHYTAASPPLDFLLFIDSAATSWRLFTTHIWYW